jgi:fumarylacetoacetase
MSWLSIAPTSQFSLANIPFGIITARGSVVPRPAIAVGDYALDLSAFANGNGFSELQQIQHHLGAFHQRTLNLFASLGRPIHRLVREYLQVILKEDTPYPGLLKDNSKLREEALVPLTEIQNHLPMHIGDYTDFYAGLNHAYNVGVLFRGADNALQPNYKHIPVGYHGRASTVVVSGKPITRPNGQILTNPVATPKVPVLSPCKKLDIELELGAFVCGANKMGENIPIAEAKDHIFGLVLMNDWSARDIQAWEYVPLGPFLSKSFGTTISPWIVLMDALEPFLVEGLEPGNRESILPYLREKEAANVYDINLEVDIIPKGSSPTTICKTSGKNLLFSFPQMLAHHSLGGCAMNTGDLLGSGTISGTEPGSQGSMLEQTENGKKSLTIGEVTRTFLEDGDEVVIRGASGREGALVGFGECRGVIKASPKI